MATDPISLQQLRNASEDAQDLEHYVNDDVPALIQTRLGGAKPNYVKFLADRNEQFQQFLLESGYQDIGDYAAGLVITARNQIFQKDGELWRAGAGLTLPYTTTGDWATEGSSFVSVGDAALRLDLADPDPNLGAALVAGVDRSVSTVADIRQQLGAKTPAVVASGYYAAGDGTPAHYVFDPTDTTSVDNGGTIIVGVNGNRWKLPPDITINVRKFGISGNGIRDNATQLAKLRAWVAAKTASGNTVKVVWPAGRYVYSQGPNWAIDGLSMEAEGEVWLIHTGAGDASFLCDASAVPGGVRGIKISGDFRVYPNASSAQGVLIRSVHVSEIQIISRGAGTGYAAIFISGCVCTEFRIRASSNDGGWANTPTHCLFVTQHEAGGQTSYCTFINPVLEGSPVGAYLDGTLGNTFIGGTMEATSDRGAHLTVNAMQNKFFSIDFEENGNYDVYCEGSHNEFLNCDTLKKILIAAGSNNKVVGGLHQAVETLAPASRTLLSSFQYNRVSGTAYPADAGSRTRFRDLTNVGTGRQHNAPPTVTQLTVGPSPYNYTNNTGNDVSVHVIPGGGAITGVSIVRGGNFLPTSTSYGNYLLSPGDGIQIEYSSLPAMFVMPR